MDFLKLQGYLRTKTGSLYTWLLKGNLGAIGKGSVIRPPFHSNNLSQVYIGDKCSIMSHGWIDTIAAYGEQTFKPRIDIEDGTYIGHRVHMCACGHMKIGKQVLFADGVYLNDSSHSYEDINEPVMTPPLHFAGPIVIEDQAWIGERVCIMPNVTIGRHSVIGSNAVVTKDVPPYSIAAGIPARVIKQYNHDSKQWEKV